MTPTVTEESMPPRRVKSLGELLSKGPPPKLRHQQCWGDWRLDAYRLVLEYVPDGSWRYEIDLEPIHESSAVLDWIFQVYRREWDLPNMLTALDAIFHCQRNLCSHGSNKQLPEGFLATRIQPPTEVEREESYRQARQFYEAWGIPTVEGQDHDQD